MLYERLLKECETNNIKVYEANSKIKGLYSDGIIMISKNINTFAEKACILAEEIGHHLTSAGDILDQSKLKNRKQEKIARNKAYEMLVTIEKIIEAYKIGCRNRFELAEFLEVTEEFLEEALQHYKEKYGLYYKINNYIVYFEPLVVFESFN